MLGSSIGQVLSHGVGVAISPLALVAIIALLTTPRAVANAVTFAITWIVALAAVVAVLVVVGGLVGANHHDRPATWVGWAKLVIGLAALAIAAQQARRALHPEPAPPERSSERDHATLGIIALATTLAMVNPKNLTQLAAAAVTISSVTPGHGARVIASVVFLLVASLCVTVPLAVRLLAGQRATAALTSWKDWATRHNATIMAVLLTILGTKSIGDAIAALTG
ncbi:GAP family protein [Nocardia macrotermitis]|uniref:Sap-like sulfolipid-1-addressing protein n=1 Tax=Nocardia macrotermitis TaxID=2585198 RepID=A0A7K0CWE4_9NOCA|nr:GAP family protein [Nocardia macrotermitis]MQY17748.1 hypothetical protein [Nocardia macrotermitis]